MYPHDWELYDTEADRTELNNLAARDPDRVRQMAAMYAAWAARCGVVSPDKLPAALKIIPAKLAAQDDPD
jgi:hypothetical protein